MPVPTFVPVPVPVVFADLAPLPRTGNVYGHVYGELGVRPCNDLNKLSS
jgi:hypothetical protein